MKSSVLKILNDLKNEVNDNISFWDGMKKWDEFEEFVANYFIEKCKLEQTQIIKQVVYNKGSNLFPDIIIIGQNDEKIGVEVKLKSSKSSGWKTLGGSVYETSKRSDFKVIFLVFGHKELLEIKTADFYESIVDIKVTHSPRYYLDIENENTPLLEELNLESDDGESIIKAFKQKTIEELKDGQSLWWVDSYNNLDKDAYLSSSLKPWSTLDKIDRTEKLVEMMVFFPEVFDVISAKNYKKIPEFLIKKYGVYTPSLRDIFSAGGKVEFLLPSSEVIELPAVHGRMYQNAKEISSFLNMESLSEYEKQSIYEDILNYWQESKEDISIDDLESIWLSKIENNSRETFEKRGIPISAREIYLSELL